MLMEMHCHTSEHSGCSIISSVDLIHQVYSKNLQGVVLTDHHYMWTDDELQDLRDEVKVPLHFLILSGQEVSTSDIGDVLVYGATETIDSYVTVEEIRKMFPYAALVWAHPYRWQRRPSSYDLLHPVFDGIEIFNSNHTVRENSHGLMDWHRYRFTALGGTDTHGHDYAGIYPTQFDHPFNSISELALEIKKGRCRPFFKEIPKSGSKALVTELTIGTKGSDEVRQKIILREIKNKKDWGKANRAFHIMEEISRCGFERGTFRVPRTIDEDVESMTIIEQGLRGKSLFDKLIVANYDDGKKSIELSAQWLAKLHNCQLRLTKVSEFIEKEKTRLNKYLERFIEIKHPHTKKATEITEELCRLESSLLSKNNENFVQGHGDYHPKNIFIGQDNLEKPETLYISAIDFENSYLIPPAFDVACFLAQFRNQFFSKKEISEKYPDKIFLDAYFDAISRTNDDFLHEVELFRARINLNIAAYLIKLGLGESKDLWRILIEAEQSLTNYINLSELKNI